VAWRCTIHCRVNWFGRFSGCVVGCSGRECWHGGRGIVLFGVMSRECFCTSSGFAHRSEHTDSSATVCRRMVSVACRGLLSRSRFRSWWARQRQGCVAGLWYFVPRLRYCGHHQAATHMMSNYSVNRTQTRYAGCAGYLKR